MNGAPTTAVVHVPTVYATYSPATGNAINTVVHELSAAGRAVGFESIVVVSEDRPHNYDDPTHVVDFGRRRGRQFRSDRSRQVDHVVTCLTGLRPPAARRFYAPIADALDNARGPVIIHNQPHLARIVRALDRHRRVFLYCHNEPFGRANRVAARSTLRDLDGVICVSDFIANRARAQLGADSPKIHTILNGVDTRRFRPRREESQTDEPVLLFVGRVSPEKGAHHLIRASVMLQSRGVHHRLRIVGSSDLAPTSGLSDYEHRLRDLAAPLGSSCEFVPFVDRSSIVEVYQSGDIFAMPTDWDDPCPLVTLEAMACGLPLIAAPRGGLPEVAGSAAVYTDVRDSALFASALEPLLRNPSLRADLRERSRRQAERLDWHRAAERLARVVFEGLDR